MCADRLTTASTASVISRAYAPASRTRCWALMIREAAISSWARVILAMDWTPRIRCLIARSCPAMLCLPYFDSAGAGFESPDPAADSPAGAPGWSEARTRFFTLSRSIFDSSMGSAGFSS